MLIIEKKIRDIIPYSKNPRNNADAIEKVANSIKQFGFKVPIIIDADGVIVAGHTRLLAADAIGMNTVPCVVAYDLTPTQIKAFRLADNKVAEAATWDVKMLQQELHDLGDMDLDFSMEDFGFDMSGLDTLLEDASNTDAAPDADISENERGRTMDAYNLKQYDGERVSGFYQMPTLAKCTKYPKELIGFNYMLTTVPRPGLGIHFYIDDYQFERIWNYPETYIEKLADFDFVLTPDFSLYIDMPMAMKVWNVYRSRMIGQILQDYGAAVIPTLSWAEKDTYTFCFDGVEPGGVVSVSTIGVKKDTAALQIWKNGMDEAIRRLKPSMVIVYGGDIGYQFPCQAIYFENTVTQKMKNRKKE